MRLGYPCLNRKLSERSKRPNHGTTVKHLRRLSAEERRDKLNRLLEKNLQNNLEILKFNLENEIFVYRFCSDIVPMATHPVADDWDYIASAETEIKELGKLVREHGFRVSMHPEQFTVLNSDKEDVVENARQDLRYHHSFLQAMGLDSEAIIILHIGGVYGERERALERFKENFLSLDPAIQERIVIENDDKSYTATEVLSVAEELKIPMVLDIHHFNINYRPEENLSDLLSRAFATWLERRPKLHFSSPASSEKPTRHARKIDPEEFASFMKMAEKEVGTEFDVMLECKDKEKALLKLRRQLQNM